ncbi:ankyrin repeat domain-containing protein [Streptomyces sp. JV176]|uniref:ankyrin repeat domain-containing protein n=1 Tax=Streptomyces sp. JV176 TaxID=858630 RepID=UPI002E78E05B|nr:ankyrin repeat domain-containing protein [Streptomyces sp. JV176]MEE1801652.1 ankyrin repeat domain-containing protein [Streptomyces sp. JV176]
MTKEAAAGVTDLFEAVTDGEDDTVVRLLRAGVSAEATDTDGETILYRAAVGDEPGMVRLLLAAGADPQRASGPEGWDLPLCAAACGGHTEVVRALLAAGAAPDGREAFDYTAIAWAVVQGFADTAETLLEYGADPDLPGPGGEAPLVLAARRGSTATVRVLLRYGAGARDGGSVYGGGSPAEEAHADSGTRGAALAEARRWMALDVEQELRAGLLSAYGEGYETVVRRIREEGSETVVVELLRDGGRGPVAGREQQTGHAAVVTLLEAELGIAPPYEELAGRALGCGDPDRDDWIEAVAALWRRGDEETFLTCAAWCASDEPLRQAFAADVLARLGATGGDGTGGTGATPEAADGGSPFAARAVPLLRELSRQAVEPELISSVVVALGQHGDPAALPEILRHTAHPEAGVRRRVAVALTGLVPADHQDGVRAELLLSRDADAAVRDRAVLALAALEADTYEIREALAARLNEPDAETAARAAWGLAVRRDPRAVAALERILLDEDPAGRARRTAVEAVAYVPKGPERRRLECTLPRRR